MVGLRPGGRSVGQCGSGWVPAHCIQAFILLLRAEDTWSRDLPHSDLNIWLAEILGVRVAETEQGRCLRDDAVPFTIAKDWD